MADAAKKSPMHYAIGNKNPNLPFHPAVRAGDYIFVSGQVPKDENKDVIHGTIEEETAATLKTIERVLAHEGATLSDVVRITTYLEDVRDFGRNVWHSSGQLHMWHPRKKKPATPWEAEIDRIFDQGVQELDPVKRKKLYDRWQAIVADKLPYIYTVLRASITAVRNRYGNLTPSTFGGVTWNLVELYVK